MSEPLPVDFRANGTVRFSVGDRRVNLRKVTWPEWKELRVAQYETNDEITELTNALIDRHEEIGEPEAKEDKRAAEKERVELNRAFNEAVQELRLTWVRKVLDLLADQPPTDDEIEPWMTGKDFMVKLGEHVQTVPLARGDS